MLQDPTAHLLLSVVISLNLAYSDLPDCLEYSHCFDIFTDVMIFMKNNVMFGFFNFSNILIISSCQLLFPIPMWMAFAKKKKKKKKICIVGLLSSLWCPCFVSVVQLPA
jgi:hypothetical protein